MFLARISSSKFLALPRSTRGTLCRGLILVAACLVAPSLVRAQGKDAAAFPEELTAIQTQYFRALEPVLDKHRKEMAELRKKYYAQLQQLGRDFVQARNQSGALAVLVEKQRLETPDSKLAAPNTKPPQELVYAREAYEEAKFKIEQNEKAALAAIATKYTQQLGVWSKLYRQRGNKASAKAVDEEIKRIEASLRGEPAEAATVASVKGVPPLIAAPKEESAEAEGDTTAATASTDPVDSSIAAVTEDGATKAPPIEKAPELPPPPAGLTLYNGWQGTASKNRGFANELSALLGPYGTPRINLDTWPGLVLYDKVRYLMPWPEARKLLGLEGKVPATGVINTPGWPGANSLKYYTYTGKFDKDYNKMTIVTDAADHVVTLMLSNDASGLNMKYRQLLPEHKFYDYVMGQNKKFEVDGIWHKIFARNLMGEFAEETENVLNPNTPCIRLDTLYFDTNLKIQFIGRWYVVKPFLDTLLYSCNYDTGTAGR